MATGRVRASGPGLAMPSRVSTGGPWLPSDNHFSLNAHRFTTWRLTNTAFYSDLARIIQRATRGKVLDKIAEDTSIYPIIFFPTTSIGVFPGRIGGVIALRVHQGLLHGSVPAPIDSHNAATERGCETSRKDGLYHCGLI